MTKSLTLISHTLCPYVQRAAIVLDEKNVPFERIYIDLADKPDWFQSVSPLGKVPLLQVGDQYLFESAPIVEYLDETQPGKLHPDDPAERAKHRAYMEFASQILNGIAALYNAKDDTGFFAATEAVRVKFAHLESQLDRSGPYFAGSSFSLVDAAFGPVFRYFDVFEEFSDTGIFRNLERVRSWRRHLAQRPSVAAAVSHSYPDQLKAFLRKRDSWISDLLEHHERRSSVAAAV